MSNYTCATCGGGFEYPAHSAISGPYCPQCGESFEADKADMARGKNKY